MKLGPIVVSCVAGLMTAACSHPSQGTDWVPPGPFANVRVASTDLWSGGDVTVISPSFKSLSSALTMRVGGRQLAVRRVNDTTIAATLPDTDATVPIHVEADGFTAFESSIAIRGFQRMRVGPVMPGVVQALPGQAAVIGAGAVGLIELNLRTNTIQRQFPDTMHSIDCMQGVGQSVFPGRFVLYGKTAAGGGQEACASTAVWQYGATPTRINPLLIGVGPGVWTVAEISNGGSIWGANNQFDVERCGPGVCPLSSVCQRCDEFLTGVEIGSLAQRAVPLSYGHVVFNTANGDSVYQFPFAKFTVLNGAAFSPAQDTVYVIGRDTVLLANSANGSVYRRVVVSDAVVTGIGTDTQQPWLYVFSIWGSLRPPELTVLDRRTLATVAVVRAPATAAISAADWDTVRLIRDPAVDRLFVVVTVREPPLHTQTSRIYSYGVPTP